MSQLITIRNFCAFFLLIAFTTAFAQVPSQGSGKNTQIAYANEFAGTSGTIESLHSYKNNTASTPVKVIAKTAIPFGTEQNLILDMQGYDQTFVRTFTFKNTSSKTHTIGNVDFAKKDNMFSFVAIEGSESSLPLEVKPGETFTVKVAFHGSNSRNTTYSDKMEIMTEEANTPMVFPIQAIQKPLSDMPWNKQASK
jgi:hypothetical protein